MGDAKSYFHALANSNADIVIGNRTQPQQYTSTQEMLTKGVRNCFHLRVYLHGFTFGVFSFQRKDSLRDIEPETEKVAIALY